ncbi:MAG: DUF5615 family PIN-like protein [Candidatus Omnitrophica bacterium]|nr:DUF5615 family PIN-like protein [Candidatus Omnitrophota bacterium]
MSEVQFYTDEHVSKAVVRGLRQRGVNVLFVVEAKKQGVSDEEHVEFAISEGRVIFTQDDDFLRIAASGKSHHGIVYAPQRTPIGRIVQGLMLIFQVLEAEEMVNRIEFL